MRKLFISLIGLLLMSYAQKAKAQIKDVTFTVSPVGEYSWWNNNLNLKNGSSLGFRAGFGFGKLVELRGIYEHSLGLKSNLTKADWNTANLLNLDVENMKVDLSRWGGEFKLNLWSGTLVTSYFVAGTGVMHFKYADMKDAYGKSYKEDQLYGSLGLGLKFNLSPRIVFALEGRDLMFKPNENKPYLNAGVNNHKLLHNAGLLASLDFYLGGHNDEEKDAVSKAYHKVFTDGFRGMKFVVEPTLAYWKFDDESAFRDQVFEGASVGVDFTSLFGIRGFYYQATKHDNQPDIKFNKDLRMYGGNIIARLNNSKGVNPYLTLGAGYLDVNSDKYVPKKGSEMAKSGWFAMGGAGLEIPLSKHIGLFGSVNAMLMEQQNNIDKITDPSSLNVGMMYTAGVRFNIGASAKSGYKVYQSQLRKAVEAQHLADMQELNVMRAEYEEKIDTLNQRIKDAVAKRDTVEVTKLVVKKQQVDKACQKIDSLEEHINELKLQTMERRIAEPLTLQAENQTDSVCQQGRKMIQLTKGELIDVVRKALNEADNDATKNTNSSMTLSDVDRLLLLHLLGRNGINTLQQGTPAPTRSTQLPDQQQLAPQSSNQVNAQQPVSNEEVIKKLDKVMNKINNMNHMRNEQNLATSIANANNANVQAAVAAAFNSAQAAPRVGLPVESTVGESTNTRFLKVNRLTLFVGGNFGRIWNTNLGIRSNMQVSNTNIDFMPELYVGLGHKNGYGISANVVYNFEFRTWPVLPYAGLGLGVFKANGTTRFGPNFIIGTSFKNIGNGKFFIDYSARNLFKNNQIAVGYRFSF